MDYLEGDKCTVNSIGDLFFDYDSREFIGANCIFLKRTKSGLIQVKLESNPNKKNSFPLKNISFRS